MAVPDSADHVPVEALLAHRQWVRALARTLYLDGHDADDLEQEVWRMTLERPPRHAASLRAWFARAARNAAVSAARRRETRRAREAGIPPSGPEPSPEEAVAEAELHARLARAVVALDEPYRTTMVLRYSRGLEASEIAERLAIPVETVRTRVKRGVRRLREQMEQEIGTDRDAWGLLLFGVRRWPVDAARPVVASTGAATVLGGGMAMAMGVKLAITGGAVAIAAAAWWLWPTEVTPPTGLPTVTPTEIQTVHDASARRARTHVDATVDELVPADTSTATSPIPEQVPLGPGVVHGRVIDYDTGAPVPNVAVSLVQANFKQHKRDRSTTTDESGAFRVGGADRGGFDALLLEAAGYADCIARSPWEDSHSSLEKHDAGDVLIYRGRTIAGRVVAADGVTPVPAASIRLSTSGGSSSQMWITDARERAATGPTGSFTLERSPPSHGYYPYTLFAVSEAGLGWTKLAGDAGRVDTTDITVTLRPIGAARVLVRDESGSAQMGLRVYAAPRFEPLGPRPEWEVGPDVYIGDDELLHTLFAADTDTQGVVTFDALPTVDERSLYDFVARAPGGWVATRSEVTPRGLADVVITVPKPAQSVIAGRVHDSEGAPVSGAHVRCGSYPHGTETDDGGHFQLSGAGSSLGAREWIEVTAKGFARVERAVGTDGADLRDLDIEMLPALPIEVRVVDQDGNPVPDAELMIDPVGARVHGGLLHRTDEEGRLVFPDTTEGEWEIQLFPPAPIDAWLRPRVTTVRAGDRDVVLEIRRVPRGNATIAMTIVDERGAPLAPDSISMQAAAYDNSSPASPHGAIELGNGRARIENVKPGSWQVWIHFPDRLGTVVSVDVAEGASEVPVRAEVGNPGVLRGRVDVGDSGAELPPMVVPERIDSPVLFQWAMPHGPKMVGAALVEDDGTFEFPAVIPGRWRVVWRGKGVVGEGIADVPAGGVGECVVHATRAATLCVRLGTTPSEGTIECWVGRPGEVLRRWGFRNVAEEGAAPTLESLGLPPGQWRWRVSFPASGTWGLAEVRAEAQEGEVSLTAGETTVVDVVVIPK